MSSRDQITESIISQAESAGWARVLRMLLDEMTMRRLSALDTQLKVAFASADVEIMSILVGMGETEQRAQEIINRAKEIDPNPTVDQLLRLCLNMRGEN